MGSVYIKSKEGAAKDVLKDLVRAFASGAHAWVARWLTRLAPQVEMARGVQHPVRGLFLRTYLSQISKNLLPDTGSEYEGEGGNVQARSRCHLSLLAWLTVLLRLRNHRMLWTSFCRTSRRRARCNRGWGRAADLHACQQMNKLWVRMQHQGPSRDKVRLCPACRSARRA